MSHTPNRKAKTAKRRRPPCTASRATATSITIVAASRTTSVRSRSVGNSLSGKEKPSG
jgi:hypothetical protein